MPWILAHATKTHVQLMVAGATSLCGLHAARDVVVEHRSELVLVPTPNQLTVARTVWEMLRRHENATRNHVQLMEVGVHTQDGQNVPRLVEVEYKSELVLVPTPNQLMVARTVLERQ